MTEMEELFRRFHKSWAEINATYERYARELGISYAMLNVLCELYTASDVLTQRTICEKCHLPKTTVNAMISGLVKQEYAELRELSEDRRQKAICLTKKGRRYAKPIMERMSDSELQAFEMLDAETIQSMLKGVEEYQRNFQEKLNQG